jgi:Acetyltransferase (isoleucine patch superfamily)
MRNKLIQLLKIIFNKFFLILFSAEDFPRTKSGNLSMNKNILLDCRVSEKVRVVPPYDLRQVSINDYSYISKNSYINNTVIGKFTSIGPNFCCGLGIHPTNGISTSPMFYSTAKQNGFSLTSVDKMIESKRITIGNDVFIGANVTVLDGVMIGDGAVVGAGAVVTKDIPAYAIAVGVPARIVKYRFEDDQIEQLQKIEWWNFENDKLVEVEANWLDVSNFIKRNK